MHRRLVLLIAVTSVLVVPGVAGAKGITGLTICGADRCVDRSAAVRADPSVMQELMSYGATVADPGPAPHLRLQEGMGDAGKTYGHSTVTYYPTLGVDGFVDGTFHRATPEHRRLMARLARGVRPFGTPAPARTVAAARAPAAAVGPSDDGGGIPTGAWLGGGAIAAVLLAVGGAAVLRRGRPATG